MPQKKYRKHRSIEKNHHHKRRSHEVHKELSKIVHLMGSKLSADKLNIKINPETNSLDFEVILPNGKFALATLPLQILDDSNNDHCNDHPHGKHRHNDHHNDHDHNDHHHDSHHDPHDPHDHNIGSVPLSDALTKLLSFRPIFGINYEPSPSNYTTIHPVPDIYYDTDFTNKDFSALWGPMDLNNPSQTGRNDVLTMTSPLKSNVVKMYNWNPARDHTPFLNYCLEKNLKVIVPISNYFVSNPDQQRENIEKIVDQSQNPIVIAYAVGNELNIYAASNIAKVIRFIANKDTTRPICSPVQIGDFPKVPAEIQKELNDDALFNSLFFQAVNVYPPPDNVVGGAIDNLKDLVNTRWPESQYSEQLLLITEYGWNSAISENIQSDSVGSQTEYIKGLTTSKPLFLGGVIFEFSDELWKPDEGGAFDGTHYGLLKFGNTTTPPDGTTTTGQHYPIDTLAPKLAYNAYISAL